MQFMVKNEVEGSGRDKPVFSMISHGVPPVVFVFNNLKLTPTNYAKPQVPDDRTPMDFVVIY